ncbi:hypothetical protein B0I37DRAFT_161772 [Chaetomium sp. MPI-CAGE-AT-0009]|nr:hypothetical protein B0I37DRAFT_161772 [Chaetomium sp. MPI-CAGE-AT-0009]
MYRANSQPPSPGGCEGPHHPGQVQAKACLALPTMAGLRVCSSDPPPPHARYLTPFSLLLRDLPRRLTSTPPPLHRPTSLGCSLVCPSARVSILLCISQHLASKPVHCWLFSLSCIYFSVSPEAVSLSPEVSSIHTCIPSIPRIVRSHLYRLFPAARFSIVLSTSLGFCKFHVPLSSHHRIAFLPCLADNFSQRPQLSGSNTNVALLITNYPNTLGARVWDSPPGNWQHQGLIRPSKSVLVAHML